jgi:hypothetical protein
MKAHRRAPHAAAGDLDQLGARIDRLDGEAALDESAGQLAGAAADFDDLRARPQAAASAPGSRWSFVDPSTSVKRKVTVPEEDS